MLATRNRRMFARSIARFARLAAVALTVAIAAPASAAIELAYTYDWGADYSGSGKAGDLAASEWDANSGNNSLLNDGQVTPGGVNGWGGGELGAIIQNTDPTVILDLGSSQALGELRLRYNSHDAFAVGNPASLSITIDGGTPIVFNSFPGAGPSPSTQYVSIDLTGNTGQLLNLAFTRSTEWLPFSEIDVFGPGSGATQVFASGYSYNAAPLVDYGDLGGELTDGAGKLQHAWPNGTVDGGPFVGWLNTNPDITFNFAGEVNLAEVVVYIADSDGGAGVGLPLSITLTTLGGFNQVFNITDPAGNGHAIPILLDGFNVLTDNLTIAISAGYQWTMLTEVEFFAAAAVSEIPTPAALPAAGAMLGLMAMRRRAGRSGR